LIAVATVPLRPLQVVGVGHVAIASVDGIRLPTAMRYERSCIFVKTSESIKEDSAGGFEGKSEEGCPICRPLEDPCLGAGMSSVSMNVLSFVVCSHGNWSFPKCSAEGMAYHRLM
jgi:hypothetical protein